MHLVHLQQLVGALHRQCGTARLQEVRHPPVIQAAGELQREARHAEERLTLPGRPLPGVAHRRLRRDEACIQGIA